MVWYSSWLLAPVQLYISTNEFSLFEFIYRVYAIVSCVFLLHIPQHNADLYLKTSVIEASNEIRASALLNMNHHSVNMLDKCLRMKPI
jgi:hypothetical protein